MMVTYVSLEDAVSVLKCRGAWRPGEDAGERVSLQLTLVRLLAEGVPVTAERLATALGWPLERAEEVFIRLRGSACEFDEEGRLLGSALTLVPTPHRLRVGDKDLYAWCALDTLFLPALLESRQVRPR